MPLRRYHVARHYDKMSTRMPWQWYLERAAKTSLRFSCGTGVMDGTVFREVLKALQAEGTLNATFAAWAEQLDSHMHGRQQHWAKQRFPYGSEFAFDTTGQEEVRPHLKVPSTLPRFRQSIASRTSHEPVCTHPACSPRCSVLSVAR
jgi:hypothetical protein